LSGNSREGRRYRDSIKATLADMGKAEGELTDSEREQLRTIGLLTLRLDALHVHLQTGNGAIVEGDLALNRVVGSLNRLRRNLGISTSRKRCSTPDPLDYADRVKAGDDEPRRRSRRTDTATAAVVHDYVSGKEAK